MSTTEFVDSGTISGGESLYDIKSLREEILLCKHIENARRTYVASGNTVDISKRVETAFNNVLYLHFSFEGERPLETSKFFDTIRENVPENSIGKLKNALTKPLTLPNKSILLVEELDKASVFLGDDLITTCPASILSILKERYNGVKKDQNYYITRVILKYSIFGTIWSSDYFLAPSSEEREAYSLELFSTPFSAVTGEFCSLFPDVDVYFGSIGSFPYFGELPTDIVVSPPSIIQAAAAHYIIQRLAEYNHNVLFILADQESETYSLLSTSNYLTDTRSIPLYNTFSGELVLVKNAKAFLLSS
jgi:hypothetical protein